MPEESVNQLFTYFAVASYRITVQRFTDAAALGGPSRVLSLGSTVTDSYRGSADIWFGPGYTQGSSTLGIAVVKASSTTVYADLPMDEIDGWLDILKDGRQAYFSYRLHGDGEPDGTADVISVGLTNQLDPSVYGRIRMAGFARALQPSSR